MRTAAYVRVSDDGKTCDHQRASIEQAASSRGDEIAWWFEDLEPSGRRDGAQLTALRRKIAGGGVGRVYIFDITRLSREGIFQTFGHIEHFRLHGCELVSVTEAIDFGGFAGDLVAAVFAAYAKQERVRMKERMASARKLAEKQGKGWGRPRRVDPTTLKAARKLQGEGQSLRLIAVKLKVPKATLHRALAGKGHYSR